MPEWWDDISEQAAPMAAIPGISVYDFHKRLANETERNLAEIRNAEKLERPHYRYNPVDYKNARSNILNAFYELTTTANDIDRYKLWPFMEPVKDIRMSPEEPYTASYDPQERRIHLQPEARKAQRMYDLLHEGTHAHQFDVSPVPRHLIPMEIPHPELRKFYNDTIEPNTLYDLEELLHGRQNTRHMVDYMVNPIEVQARGIAHRAIAENAPAYRTRSKLLADSWMPEQEPGFVKAMKYILSGLTRGKVKP
jgi:hypothetical protein